MEAYQRDFARYNRRRRAFFRWFFKYYHRLEVIGLDHLPPGPALIVANHGGGMDLDIVALGQCSHPEREIHVLIAESWHYLNHWWGKYYIGAGIPLWTRGGIRWEYMDPYLTPDASAPGWVAIYPEGGSGSFRDRRRLRPFFPGVVRIALHYRVPIVPAAQIGFHRACPVIHEIPRDHGPGDVIAPLFSFPRKLKIEFGPPFTLDQYFGRDLTRAEETEIANEIVRPRLAAVLQKHGPLEMPAVAAATKECS